ncbi:MAG: FAD-dependent oxidoreductase [Hymenobacter sp.]
MAIVGAGPAGTACALALRGRGHRVVLLDKAVFPRDKILRRCHPRPRLQGVAPARPGLYRGLWQLHRATTCAAAAWWPPAAAASTCTGSCPPSTAPASTSMPRCWHLVRQHTATEIRENAALKNVEITTDCARLTLADGQEITSRLVVGRDGAQSVVGRRLLPEPRLARAPPLRWRARLF